MDSKKYKVLLLSAPIGSGHRMAAEAIKEELESYNDIEVVHGNIFSFFPRFLGDIFLCVYIWILKVCPWLYQKTYSWGDKESGSVWLKNLINQVLLYLGNSFLNNVNPDVVIATHATPAGIMSLYKKKHPNVFVGVVVTDFTVHKWWIYNNVDAYFIADDRLKGRFPEGANVNAFGIPIRKEFALDNSLELRRKFGWPDDEKVCLIMGGGEGLLPMEEIISTLNNCKLPNFHIISICGNNEKLKNKLDSIFGKEDNIEIVGFTDNAPKYMKAADIIITKAGGLTSSEVLASNLQFLIYRPLPGQELNNAAFLERHYNAHVCRNTNELASSVKDLIVSDISDGDYDFRGKFASKRICEYIFTYLTS